MDVLARRVLCCRLDSGNDEIVTLSVYVPFKTDGDDWQCIFQFGGARDQRIVRRAGSDFIQALMCCLEAAAAYIERPDEPRSYWQGLSHCGLPRRAPKPASYSAPSIPAPEPNPGTLDVLTTRQINYRDESGAEREALLTMFRPSETHGGTWLCGVAFGPSQTAPVRYCVGADAIEAILNALAIARLLFEAMAPNGESPPGSVGCGDLPYCMGRSYYIDMVGDLGPEAPDFLRGQWGS
jgi:hypothetical protein